MENLLLCSLNILPLCNGSGAEAKPGKTCQIAPQDRRRYTDKTNPIGVRLGVSDLV